VAAASAPTISRHGIEKAPPKQGSADITVADPRSTSPVNDHIPEQRGGDGDQHTEHKCRDIQRRAIPQGPIRDLLSITLGGFLPYAGSSVMEQ
jgi:hypothetical protein